MIGLWSILSAFAVFIGVVVVLQVLARKFWARLTTQPKAFSDVHSSQVDRPIKDDPNYQNSAIRSAKR